MSPDVFYVTRESGTEPPLSSPLNRVKAGDGGTFLCTNCGQPLFTADQKYDSGTGWPSFFDHIPYALGYDVDYKLGYAR